MRERRNFVAAGERRQIVVRDPTQIVIRGQAGSRALALLTVRCRRPLTVVAATVASIAAERRSSLASFAAAVARATKLPTFDVYAGRARRMNVARFARRLERARRRVRLARPRGRPGIAYGDRVFERSGRSGRAMRARHKRACDAIAHCAEAMPPGRLDAIRSVLAELPDVAGALARAVDGRRA